METVQYKTVNRAATVQKPAASLMGVQRQAVAAKSSVQIQASMKVSSPKDPAEKEADVTAKKIMRMAVPESSIAYVKTDSGGLFRQVKQEEKEKKVQTKLRSPYITRFADSGIFTQPKKKEDEKIQRKAEGQPNVASNVAADIQNSMAAGSPLPLSVRRFMEPRFQANFSNVKIHTGDRSAKLNRQLNAQAFTAGNQIFFGKDKFKPDTSEGKELIAHELTHTIQQGAAVQRSEDVAVTQQSPLQVQRLGLSDILDGLADLAANVPGFTLLTVIIGRNPINLRVVERNFTNLLRGFMGLIPGGEILFQVLQNYRVVERIGIWVDQQMQAMGISYDDLRRRFTTFTDSLGVTDIFSPEDVWQRAQNIFTEPIARIRNFISRLIDRAIAWLKETFMEPLSNFCREIPGYTLVTVLLGRDPFTNTPVDRSPLNLVRAFAEFIPGGTEKVNQLVESRGLQRAYEWFVQETQARNLTWARVAGTFSQAWNSLRLEDVLHPIDTLQRLVAMFRPLMSDLVGFAGAALMKLLELIYEAVMGAGGARILAILKRGRDTFLTIIRNPVGFLGNLLGAVGQGVRQFRNNILQHLQQGVIAWLTGPVARAGIQMPERWDVRGIIGFVMQILGLTWDRIRQKLVRLMGERAVATLEAGFQLIQEIRERGLVQALRDRVTEFFGQLREVALGSIKSFIQQRLVMAGIQQLLSLLSPVGAVIQAIIKTYTTVQFFIQKIDRILDLVESIVNSTAAIASGAIGAASALVERTMARTIPVILDFLARFIGVGDVGGQVQSTIRGLQARVDGMLDRAVDWIRSMAQRVGSAIIGGQRQAGVESPAQLNPVAFSVQSHSYRIYVTSLGGQRQVVVESSPPVTVSQYIAGLTTRVNNLPNTDPSKAALQSSMSAVSTMASSLNAVLASSQGLTAPRSATADDYRRFAERLRNLIELAAHGAHTGTDSDPIPLVWFKAWSNYQPINLVINGQSRTLLPGRSNQYIPAPPRGGFGGWIEQEQISVGVQNEFRPSIGMRLRRIGPGESTRTARGTGAVRLFTRLLAHYGFNVASSAMAVDHVKDIGFGGPDDKPNLWPLNATANNAANEVYRQHVWVLDRGIVRVDQVENLMDKRFIIRIIR